MHDRNEPMRTMNRAKAPLAILCGAALVAGLAGCGSGADDAVESKYSAVAVVVADTATNPAPSLTQDEQTLVKNVMLTHGTGNLTVISAAGEPRTVRPDLVEFDPSQGNATGNTVRANSNMLDLADAMAAMHAASDEQSTLEAIAMAADFLDANADGEPTLMIVHSNGLDTAGPLAMQRTLAANSASELADAAHRAVPGLSLDGITVRLTGLGYLADDAPKAQERPSAAVRSLIEDIWTRTLKTFGPADVEVDRTPLSGKHASGATRKVTAVELPSTSVTCTSEDVNYRLPSALLFAPDSAVPSDAAKDLLKEPAALLRDNPGATVTVTGHAYADPAYDAQDYQAISESRAAAIADVLRTGYGIDPSRITSRGVGADRPTEGSDGAAGPEAQRRVDVVVSGASDASCTVG
ncbi:OmpA family protein [Bifidobacterium platyrrhinorum]|nr:OmpA family protein [Bifidobacterium platyrrhinorum]